LAKVRVLRQLQSKIDPLSHRHGKPAAAQRLDVLAIDSHQLGIDFPRINGEYGRRCGIDDPQANASTAFNPDDLGIIRRAVICGFRSYSGTVVSSSLVPPPICRGPARR
jgi:hypothetical protein